MPRIARVVAEGVPHHVTQRGNNRQQVFFSDVQRRFYLSLLSTHADEHRLRILGYSLMPNHIHAIVVPERLDSMARAFGRTHNLYSRWFNRLRGRSGHLWQNRFYSAPLDSHHLIRALQYVDLNPVRAGIVDEAMNYRWSSARAHGGQPDPHALLDTTRWKQIAPSDDWADVLKTGWSEDQQWMLKLRSATFSGKPLGSKEFVKRLERKSGVTLKVRGPGRPRKRPTEIAASVGSQ